MTIPVFLVMTLTVLKSVGFSDDFKIGLRLYVLGKNTESICLLRIALYQGEKLHMGMSYYIDITLHQFVNSN